MSTPLPAAVRRRTGAAAVPAPLGGPPPSLSGDAPDAVLAKLELTVRRRLDGLLQGNHLGLVPGPGSEAGESRLYHPGDDVRRMDWPVTARTTVPHVRETIADRELETWIVVDLSPSLDFGTAACEKRDLAVAGAAAVSYLTQHGGNRVGAIITTGDGLHRHPALPGRAHARGLVRAIARTPRGEQGRRGDLGETLTALRNPPRRRGLAVVISDFLGEPTWERPMRALATRHELLAIEVIDPRELELPSVGLVMMVDPEDGRTVEVPTGRRDVRRRYAEAAAEQRREIAAAIRRTGAAQLTLRTDRDWLVDILRFVIARRRGASGGALR